MPRKQRPQINTGSNPFRESYRFSVGRFVRGSKEIKNGDWSKLKYVKPLGCGASGSVALYYNNEDGKYVAVKTISVSAKANRDQLIHEEDCLDGSEQSEFIVKKNGFYISEGYVNIVLEYMDQGSMNRHYSRENPVPDRVLRCFAWQLLMALLELKALKIVHRDIKPANILLDSSGKVKLSDFGISKKQPNFCSTYVGTLKYMSPERLKTEEYTYRCDYWSVAMVILEAALGYYPIGDGDSKVDLVEKITDQRFDSVFELVNPELASFLKDWLQEERRRTLVDFKIKDPWLYVDGERLTKEKSMSVIADWLQSSLEDKVSK